MSPESSITNSACPKSQPFICHLPPFIGQTKPIRLPFVGKKLPSVRVAGFTMIELIITMTIAGIIMALAVPAMTNLIKTHRLSGQANDLVGDLAFARSEAIKRGTTITICKQDAGNSSPRCDTNNTTAWTPGWTVFIDTDNDGQIDSGEMVLRVRPTLEGNNYITSALTDAASSSYDNAALRIRFRNNGATTLDPATAAGMARLRLCDNRGNRNALTIEIAPPGRARVNSIPPTAPATCPTASNWT